MILGRAPTEHDTASAPRVAFLSQAMAKQAFPQGSPLGRTISLMFKDAEYVVAGVVADAHYSQVKGEPPLTVYVPYEQPPWRRLGSLHFVVQTHGKPEALVSTIRSLVRELDPNLPLINVQTQQAVIDDQLRRERLFANLSTAFGAMALLLASIGIYGVVAYSVARRTAEIGIRMALGARYGNIVRLVLRRTVLLVAVGTALGIAGALAVTRFVSSMLYNVRPRDPATFIAAARAPDSDRPRGRLPAGPPGGADRSHESTTLRVRSMPRTEEASLLQGTLDMMILKTLTLGPMHGYAITEFIHETSENLLRVEEGALYPALHRLELRGLARLRVGRVGEQPARQVLPADAGGPEAAGSRVGGLAASQRRGHAGDGDLTGTRHRTGPLGRPHPTNAARAGTAGRCRGIYHCDNRVARRVETGLPGRGDRRFGA